ncbi:EF-hand domain-containing protein [Rhodoplanes azumiensis]|uniref:EF-hand domain-containing protein n=1 Tax=Rhodoplanes azumiensis TaxID=1897628 RepID=A0ABW5ADT3_9BRAD
MFLTGSALSALDVLDTLKSLFGSNAATSQRAAGQFSVEEEGAGKTKAKKATQGTGVVSSETMQALLALQAKSGGGALASQAFARFDKDGSGRIDKTEFDDILTSLGGRPGGSSATSLFETLDADDDGGVSQDELTTALSRRSTAAASGLRSDATVQEQFQRMLRQQLEMVATQPTGAAVKQLI